MRKWKSGACQINLQQHLCGQPARLLDLCLWWRICAREPLLHKQIINFDTFTRGRSGICGRLPSCASCLHIFPLEWNSTLRRHHALVRSSLMTSFVSRRDPPKGLALLCAGDLIYIFLLESIQWIQWGCEHSLVSGFSKLKTVHRFTCMLTSGKIKHCPLTLSLSTVVGYRHTEQSL